MKLLVKFNLLFIILFGAGVGITALISHSFLRRNARDEVVKQAELMMETSTSTRRYTEQQIKPLLASRQEQSTKFVAQTVPAFAAVNTFNYLRKNYPEYSYREPALNPTNPADRAVDWEADIINYFRTHPEEQLLIGERESALGRMLYLGRPLRAAHSCLECHSTPAAAPASMIASYGPDHGFGWKENEVVASQIVAVPMVVPEQIADRAFGTLLTALAATSLLTLVIIDVALFFFVIRPVGELADMADRISKGELHIPELTVKGADEISHLTASFNRMYLSLVKAIRMLED